KKIYDNSSLQNKEKLEQTIQMLISAIKEKSSSDRVFFHEIRHLNKTNILQITETRNKFKHKLENVDHQGIKVKEFKTELPADMITFGILGLTNYSYNWFDPSGEISPDELARIFSNMIFHGIV